MNDNNALQIKLENLGKKLIINVININNKYKII